jgi:hypothetical protein
MRERGAILGIVLVLLVLILAASGFAFWGLRGETQSAANDRLSRQLFDCAEEALAIGKVVFGNQQRAGWDGFLNTDVCSLSNISPALPCPSPFPSGASGTPPAGYPTGKPYQDSITVDKSSFIYNIGIYNNPENVLPNPKCTQLVADPLCKYHDGDSTVVVYARCWDTVSGQSRATQAVINAPMPSNGCPYRGMAGASCRGQGNQN